MPAEAPARSNRSENAAAAEPVATPQLPATRGPGLDQPVKPGAALALLKEPAATPRPATPQEQLEGFAKDLRELRTKAGLGYPEMAELSHYTMKTLASAAGGLNLPTLPVTMAYARACEGSVAEWEDRWHRLADAMKQAAGAEDGGDSRDASDARDSRGGGARHSRGTQDDPAGQGAQDSRGERDWRDGRDWRDERDLRGARSGPDERDLRDGPEGPGERVRRSEPWPSQVASPPSAPSGGPAGGTGPAPEQAPGAAEQVYVITSAAPRRPQR